MHASLLFIILLLASGQLRAQQMSCCVRNVTNVAMYTDPAFIAAHEAPLPLHFTPVSGSFVTFKTASGPDARAYLVKSPNPRSRVLLVFHEWWGLNDYIKQEAEKLQKELGIDVMAVDLFDGKVASTPEEASKISSGATPERMMAIIQGAIDNVGSNRKIETLGWCFGGGWALQATILAGKSCTACVMYYGLPETDPDKLAKIQAPILGIFGSRDTFITPEKVDAFRVAMKAAGKKLTVKSYDADHAFANPSNPHFNKAAKEDSEKLMLKFLKKHT